MYIISSIGKRWLKGFCTDTVTNPRAHDGLADRNTHSHIVNPLGSMLVLENPCPFVHIRLFKCNSCAGVNNAGG